MTRARHWRHDGPPASSQGFGHSWVICSAMSRMSAEHGWRWRELFELRAFFVSHPELASEALRRYETENVAAEKIIEWLMDVKQRYEEERARRQRVLVRQ